MSLTNCFIDDQYLVEMSPLFDQMRLQLGDVMNPVVVHTLMQLLPDTVVYTDEVRAVGWPESWSDVVWCFTG